MTDQQAVTVAQDRVQFCINAIAKLQPHKARFEMEKWLTASPEPVPATNQAGEVEHGYVAYGPDGHWHWSSAFSLHESIEEQRPATLLEKRLFNAIRNTTETLRFERVTNNHGCKIPPEGWRCSREPGHEGPCAARETGTADTILTWYKTLSDTARQSLSLRDLHKLARLLAALATQPATSQEGAKTAADWVNSIPGVKAADQFIALDRRVFEDCVARALAATQPATSQEGEDSYDAHPNIGFPVAAGTQADEIGTWQKNVEFLLAKCPHTIRGHEGGGSENLIVSLVLTFGKMQHMLAATPTPPTLSEDLRGFLTGANITQPVTVTNHEETGNGTSSWSEVRVDRPHNGQVAHCADQEDADLIAALINAALAQVKASTNEGNHP